MVKIYYLDFWAERYGNPVILEDINNPQKWKEADKIMSRELVSVPTGVGLLHINELSKYLRLEKAKNADEADVLITSCFGNEKAKYKDTNKKIIVLGYEKDVAEMDYHKYSNVLYVTNFHFEKPCCKFTYLPLFYLYRGFNLTKTLFERRKKPKKEKFCLSIISNNAVTERNEILEKVMEYKKVDNFGNLLKNENDKLIERTCWYDSRLFEKIKPYKFMIAFENGSIENYHTEKLLNAWLGNSIPIYWGDPNINKYFNSKAFININELGVEKAIEKIKELDENEELYNEMFNEPLLTNECKNISFLNEDKWRKTIKDFMLKPMKKGQLNK